MTAIDIASLLQPLDGDLPSGPNLEYDAEFLELERLLSPAQERAVGDSVIAAAPPDWPAAAALAQRLLARSRDLRVAVQWTAAQLHIGSLAGWASGLELLRGLLERSWDSVHPQLDADDDQDPTERINALAPLADPAGMLQWLRRFALFRGAHPAHFSLRQLRIAQGNAAAAEEAEEARDIAAIEACCGECPLQDLLDARQALATAGEHLAAIGAVFQARTPGDGPDLEPLQRDVRELLRFIDPHARARSGMAADADVGAGEAVADAATAAPQAFDAVSRIEGRQDVQRCLDALCAYYQRHEPSSPVPLLLRRARRLIGLNFADLLRDLAPAGVSELEHIAGSADEGD